MTAWLIDGYNLLYVVGLMEDGFDRSLESRRSALLGFLADAMSWEDRCRMTVIFDAAESPPGAPRHISHRGIMVRFSVGYESADAMIEHLIRVDSSPKQLVVVSSDHRIQRAATRRRAQAVDSDVWYRRIARAHRESIVASRPERPPVPLLSEDVDYWVRRFGGAALLDRQIEDIGRHVDAEQLSTGRPVRTSPPPARKKKSPTDRATRDLTEETGRSKKRLPSRKPPRRKHRRIKTRSTTDQSSGTRPGKSPPSDFTNPFPPGYAEDIIEQEGDIE